MSKVALVIDVFAPADYNNAQASADSAKLLYFANSIQPFGKATICPTIKATTSWLRLRLTYLRNSRGWEVGMSDNFSGDDILDYPPEDQKTILQNGYYYSQHCYVCGTPLPTVDSYLPQGGMDSGVQQMLDFLGISHIVVPNAVYADDDLIAKFDQGGDMIILISTNDMPATGSMKKLIDFLAYAKAHGGKIVKLNEM